MRSLTEDEMLRVEMHLADMMPGHLDEIATALGIDPAADWTDEEQARINAEFDRRFKPQVIADFLADADAA